MVVLICIVRILRMKFTNVIIEMFMILEQFISDIIEVVRMDMVLNHVIIVKMDMNGIVKKKNV